LYCSLPTPSWPSSLPLSLWVPLHSLLLNCIFLSKSMADPVPFASGYLFSYFYFICLFQLFICYIYI
jgi:hypothetical protein